MSNRLKIYILILLSLTIIGFFNSGWKIAILAIILFFFTSLPLLIKMEKGDNTLPFFEFVSLLFGIYFALPALISNPRNVMYYMGLREINENSIINGISIAMLGYIFLCAGFFGLKRARWLKIIPQLKIPPITSANTINLSVILMIFYIISQIFSQIYRVPFILKALFYLFKFFPRIAIGLLFIQLLQKKLTISIKIIFFLFVIYILLQDISSGLLAPLLFDIVLFLFLLWYSKRIFPFTGIVIATIFILPFFGEKDTYRQYVWFSGLYKGASTIKKTSLFIDLISKDIKKEKFRIFKRGFIVLQKRINHLSELSICIEETPLYVPYWGIHSLTPLLTALIPRFIMPWKPQDTMGQEFGHRYNFIAPEDYATSVNLPMLTELYIDFGVIGVIIGMFLIGSVYRILYRVLNYPGLNDPVAVIGSIIFMVLMNIESNISLVFGNIVEYIITLYLIFLSLYKLGRGR